MYIYIHTYIYIYISNNISSQKRPSRFILLIQATCLPRDLLHLEIAGRDDHGRPTATPGACTAAVASPSPWPDPPWASPESKPQSPKVVRCRLSPPPPGNMGSSKIQPLGIQSPSQRMIGVHIHLLNKVFRFHYHSQKVIGSLGNVKH